MSANCKPPDYKKNTRANYAEYKYSKREWIIYSVEGMLLVVILGYFFYRSWIWTCFLSPLCPLFLQYNKKELGRKQKEMLSLQFKDVLRSVNSALQAGYSIENAFLEAYKDMLQYYGRSSMIVRELEVIQSGLRNNHPVEELVQEFGDRSGVEDIMDFAQILFVGKKSGGSINEIIQSAITVIEEKMDMKQEIQTVISARKMEAKIMSVIPFLIILYIDMTSMGYFDTLYQTLGGNLLMTICLGVYIAAVFLSIKIINIDVV